MSSRKWVLKQLKDKLCGIDLGSRVVYASLEELESYRNIIDRLELCKEACNYVAIYPKRFENIDEWERVANPYCLNLWKKVLVDLSWDNIDIDDKELSYVSLTKDSLRQIRINRTIQNDPLPAPKDWSHGPKLAWTPLHGSQGLFLTCPAYEALYDGGRGFGKTDTLINDFLQDVNVGWGNRWQGLLLRKSYGELKDVIDKTKRVFPYIFPGARYIDKPAYKWIFPDGEALQFGYLETEEDYERYHGQEYQWIGVEEITLWETGSWVDNILTCLRSPIQSLGKRLRFRATTNPFGAGRNWVKQRFIDRCRFGQVYHYKQTIEAGGKVYNIDRTRTCVFGNVLENETILESYLPTLIGLSDVNQKKAHLLGSWDVVSGGLLDDLWRDNVHMIPPFPIPEKWKIDRSYDHGEGHPFSVGWWAEADGKTAVSLWGKEITFPKGTLFRIDEIYGAVPGNDKEGLRLTVPEISAMIKTKETTSHFLKDRYIYAGPAESAMWVPKSRDDSARMFEREGITWLPVNKKAGSRIIGKDLLRARLKASLDHDKTNPHIYFFSNCEATKRILPYVQRDENKIEDAEKCDGDDLYDEILYKLLGPKETQAARIEFGAK